jgi:hypothetical protein
MNEATTTLTRAATLAADANTVTPDPQQRAERAVHAATLRDRVGEADFDLLGPMHAA